MIKKLFLNYTLLSSFTLFATFEELPQIIDFSSFRGSVEEADYDPVALSVGYAALNYAPEINGIFSIIKRDYNIDTIVETGTYKGASTQLFSILFNSVHTIEISENFYNSAKNLFKNSPNVQCHLGSSEVVLHDILPSLKEKSVLFYLDAHWNANWPLLKELEEIGITHYDNCIVIIDDFKVPGRNDIPYDYYGGHECSYEYIENQLNKVFSDYTINYIIPKSVKSRAKIVLIPKVLKKQI